jgi:beta-N-acetylhexosaminidase
MSSKDIRNEVGHRLWIGFEGSSVDADLRQTLSKGDAGGVTLFARNLPKDDEGGTHLDELLALNTDIHRVGEDAGHRIWISVDQEGGRVQRIKAPAPIHPPMLSFAELGDDEAKDALTTLGETMGRDLADWGFDIDFAPVMDIHTNDENPIIGDRAFGRDAPSAILRALAFAEGLAKAGILSCCKHFPGHGDTQSDSHLELPRLDHDMERLRRVELAPFKAAAEAKIPLCMTAHVIFSAIDPSVPATLSKAVVGDLLRCEIGYKGVVVSDDLDMKAISNHMGVDEAAVRAIEA